MWVPFALLLLAIAGQATTDDEPPLRNQGVAFLNPTTVVLSTAEWRILVEVNISKLHEDLRKLDNTTTVLIGTLGRLMPITPQLAVGYQETRRAQRIFQEMNQMVAELRAYLPPNRVKRGLFNVGGKLINFLFGNPDADDWEMVQKGIQAGTTNEHRFTQVETAHLIVTKSLSGQLQANTRRLQQVTDGVINSTLLLQSYQNHIHKWSSVVNQTLDGLRQWSDVQFEIVRTREMLRELTLAVGDSALGILSPYLISPTELSALVTTIQRSLPREFTMLAGPEVSQAHQHYQSARVTGWHAQQTLYIALSFPLETLGPRYKVYEVAVMPVLERIGGHPLRLDTPFSHFLVSDDREFYAPLPLWDVTSCRRKPVLVCPPVFPLIHRSQPSCLSDLYYQASEAEEHCEWKVLVDHPPAMWQWEEAQHQWHYYLANSTIVTQQCPGKPAVEKTLQGRGVFRPIPQCTVRTKTHQLLPTNDVIQEEHHVMNLEIDTPILVGMDRPPTEERSMELRQIVQQLRHQGQAAPGPWSQDEVRLASALELLQASEETQWSTLDWTLWTIGATATVAGLVAVGWKLTQLWLTLRYRQPPTQIPEAPVINHVLAEGENPQYGPQRPRASRPISVPVPRCLSKETAGYAAPLKKGGAM